VEGSLKTQFGLFNEEKRLLNLDFMKNKKGTLIQTMKTCK
jgi:hypothetical protein